jgi:D-amino-acid oxidase
MENKKNITVVGAGVSGLTTAIVLLEEGHAVQIVSDKLPQDTTSAKAAAIWLPYQIGPQDKVNQWSNLSYEKFKDLSRNPDSGVSMITARVFVDEKPLWMGAIPNDAVEEIPVDELVDDCTTAYDLYVPLAETQVYLDFLLNWFKELGGTMKQEKVTSLKVLVGQADLVINCTGLGSQDLVKNADMFPIRGQIVKVKPNPEVDCQIKDYDLGEGNLTYIIPRGDCIVLGGTALAKVKSEKPNEQTTAEILERCIELDPDLEGAEVLEVIVGLRPGRKSIALKRDGNVIHNYGHGGGGFTVSWGCALAKRNFLCVVSVFAVRNFPNFALRAT